MKVVAAFLLLALVICVQVDAGVIADGVALDKPKASEQGLLPLTQDGRHKRGSIAAYGRRKRGSIAAYGRRKRGAEKDKQQKPLGSIAVPGRR
ncbi:hypothetical protein AAVH_17616 [Aphelenchoides avenae]|nr:hypothetical protein AAVH_17616 [Aphelenchus avenae]